MEIYEKGDKLVVEVESVTEGFVKLKDIENIMFHESALNNLEYLDGDYVNENFGSLQDEAYSEGIKSTFDLIKKLRYMDYDDKVIWFGLLDDGKEKWLEIIERYSYEEIISILEKYEKQ